MSSQTLTPTPSRRRRLAARLGIAGGALGVAAGLVQLSVGARLPELTGAKSSPVALGLLTVAVSLLAGGAALRQREPAVTIGGRTACAAALILAGLLSITTVGVLWFATGPLLLVAGVLTVDDGRATLRQVRSTWPRTLVTVLGASQLLMAAGAGPLVASVGAVSGAALVAAAWIRPARRGVLVALLLVGTVPMAALAWTAVAPLLVLLLMLLLAPLLLGRRRQPTAP